VKTHAVTAVRQLAGLLGSADERLRRQVCKDIIEHALRVRELEDVEQRVTALEKAAKKC
jgi:hypothetical protein